MLPGRARIEALARDALVSLLERIGPAILLVHSQSGPYAWLVADARPDLVKSILSIEPNGPPFREVELLGTGENGEPWYRHEDVISRPWGVARERLTYARDGMVLENRFEPVAQPAPRVDLVAPLLQPQPAATLARLAGKPILMVTEKASYHAPYDHATSAFLAQAGVAHEHVYLAEHGLRGNGHMVMLEHNNHEIADLLLDWIRQTSYAPRGPNLQVGTRASNRAKSRVSTMPLCKIPVLWKAPRQSDT
jgi:pimeloyl-ACP methyl ester carboxylesterase